MCGRLWLYPLREQLTAQVLAAYTGVAAASPPAEAVALLSAAITVGPTTIMSTSPPCRNCTTPAITPQQPGRTPRTSSVSPRQGSSRHRPPADPVAAEHRRAQRQPVPVPVPVPRRALPKAALAAPVLPAVGLQSGLLGQRRDADARHAPAAHQDTSSLPPRILPHHDQSIMLEKLPRGGADSLTGRRFGRAAEVNGVFVHSLCVRQALDTFQCG